MTMRCICQHNTGMSVSDRKTSCLKTIEQKYNKDGKERKQAEASIKALMFQERERLF